VRPPNVLKVVAPEIVKHLKLGDTIYAAVDRIIEQRVVNGKVQYKVRWKKHSAVHDSWIKREDFFDLGPILAFEKRVRDGRKKTQPEGEVPDQPSSVITVEDNMPSPIANEAMSSPIIEEQSIQNPTPSDEIVAVETTDPVQNSGTIRTVGSQDANLFQESLGEQGTAVEQTVDVSLALDPEQKNALGPYWLTMPKSRHRSAPIVESDDEV